MVTRHIPEQGKSLVQYKGRELVDRLGADVIADVVTSVLCGGNVRALTEKLTQRRILLSHAAMLRTFLSYASEKDGAGNLLQDIDGELRSEARLKKEEKTWLQWMLGLTTKSVQNVLRSSEANRTQYLRELAQSLETAAEKAEDAYGGLAGEIQSGSKRFVLDWRAFFQLTLALGTQTLALRGAEKSMYGKFFEKLVLGTLLSTMGFRFVGRENATAAEGVFWLSERGERRESDATLLVMPGKGVRFDIGFIGVGNTEISLDKVTRFEQEIERGGKRHLMKTIILVDSIGAGSRIVDMARGLNAHIVQMSMNFWVREVAEILAQEFGFEHELLRIPKEQSIDYIALSVKTLDLNAFLKPVSDAK